MGWRGTVAVAIGCLAACAGCAAQDDGGTNDLCVVTPVEVAQTLGVDVADVGFGPAGEAAPASATNFRCTYTAGGSADRVVDISGWPGTPAIGNEEEDPDGTRNPEPATVAGSPTAYFTNSGKAIRFGDGKNVYTIWIYDGTRPEPASLERLAETVLTRLSSAATPAP